MTLDAEWSRQRCEDHRHAALRRAREQRLIRALRRQRRAEQAAQRARLAWLAVPVQPAGAAMRTSAT